MSLTRFARVVAAAALAAAAYAGVPLAPASAATCATADGVSVVVDYHELGGGLQSVCLSDGGGDRASDLFPAAGFTLTYVQRQPGFVCRVDGKPASDPCVNTPPADAYWGLWWSDGKSGRWTYASTGVSGLTVPDGGYVALSWNGSSGNVPPGVSPTPHPSGTPTPTHAPTHATSSAPPAAHSSQQGSASAAPTGASATAGPSLSAKPGKKKAHSGRPSPSQSASPESESPSASPDTVAPTAGAPANTDGGLPTWVAPVVVAVLFGAVGTVVVVRRRRGASGA